jgi:hypothetical protein
MSGLVRAALRSSSGVVRILVLCHGCLQGLASMPEVDPKRWVRPFGQGDGSCELCEREIHRLAQSD